MNKVAISRTERTELRSLARYKDDQFKKSGWAAGFLKQDHSSISWSLIFSLSLLFPPLRLSLLSVSLIPLFIRPLLAPKACVCRPKNAKLLNLIEL